MKEARLLLSDSGVPFVKGYLRQRGIHVQTARIRRALQQLRTPVQQLESRSHTVTRRAYSVPGPLALVHHDGHHSLVLFGIVIHAFIDGHTYVEFLACTHAVR